MSVKFNLTKSKDGKMALVPTGIFEEMLMSLGIDNPYQDDAFVSQGFFFHECSSPFLEFLIFKLIFVE